MTESLLQSNSCHPSGARRTSTGFQKGNEPTQDKQMGKNLEPELEGIDEIRLTNMILQFGLDVPESDALTSDYSIWKNLDIAYAQPPTMIIDISISSRDLKSNEALVMHDEYGKTRYVDDAVRSYHKALHMDVQSDFDIVLERWQFDLGMFNNEFESNLVSVLPKMYKNAVVLFRAVYALLHLLPTWKLSSKSDLSMNSKGLPKLKYRVYEKSENPYSSERDGLYIPLPDSHSKDLDVYEFETLETPSGKFRIKVNYRRHCDFRIETSEATLSSRIDESDLFKPSLRYQSDAFDSRKGDFVSPHQPKSSKQILRDADQVQQAYGSLSTYHLAGRQLGSSPLSTLRAARDFNSTPPGNSPPTKLLPERRTSRDSYGSLKSEGSFANTRGTLVNFTPFKSPSLSASPSPLSGDHISTSRVSGLSGNKSSAMTALAEARHPGYTQQPSQYSSTLPTPIPASSTVSSRPTPKYSSSFSHRRSRNSVNLSKDDDASSGQASPRPGSRAGEVNTSSGSLNADDDNISDFLKMLDSKKDLKSFRPPDASLAETSRTTVKLSKFSHLRDSNAVLSDSMSSSVLGHRSSSSSSRQLSSVPAMVGGTSTSTASSPGERMSPRTPHTPAIPSRLSANSIIEYTTHRERSPRHVVSESDDAMTTRQSSGRGPIGAIDIPSSPRIYEANYRRSSSVAQQNRTMAFGDDDPTDALPFGNRSTSLGGNGERTHLSLNRMLAMHDDAGAEMLAGPLTNQAIESAPMSRQVSANSQDDTGYHAGSSSRGAYRFRGVGRGHLGPQGSSTSLVGDRGSASGGSDSRGGRHSFQRSRDLDEEELLFAMSDFGVAQQQQQSQQGRRSLEEGGGGKSGK